jgi:hypothetical protein
MTTVLNENQTTACSISVTTRRHCSQRIAASTRFSASLGRDELMRP